MSYGRNAQGVTISIGNWHEALLFTLILLCATEAAVVYDELPSKSCSDIDQTCGQGRLDTFGGLKRKLIILFEMQNYY